MFGSSLRVAMAQVQLEPTYKAQGVRFSGDSFRRGSDFSGNADGKLGLVSIWFKRFGLIGQEKLLWSVRSIKFNIRYQTDNKLRISDDNSSVNLDLRSTTAVTDTSSWHHLLASWNLNTTTAQLYLDGVEDADVVKANNGNIDYTGANHSLGSAFNGSLAIDAELADPYINYKEWLDLSVEANRLKFRNVIGKPEFLGANGELPTGTSPIAHFTGEAAEWNAGQNRGTGGNFTMSGSVTDATSSPSD